MSPSLKEKFNQIFPPETRDEVADLEDMIGQVLTLKRRLSVRDDRTVEITEVDLEKDKHVYAIDGGKGTEFQETNDADIYE